MCVKENTNRDSWLFWRTNYYTTSIVRSLRKIKTYRFVSRKLLWTTELQSRAEYKYLPSYKICINTVYYKARKPTRPNGLSRLRQVSNLTLAVVGPWSLTSWFQKSVVLFPCPVDNLCQFATKPVHSFQNIMFTKTANRQTEGWTNDQVENIMIPVSLD